jgi:hypothetical protein
MEVTIGKTFLMLDTAGVLDPWTEADEDSFIPLVVLTMSRGPKKGRLLYQTPLGYRVQVGTHGQDVPKELVALMGAPMLAVVPITYGGGG